MLSSGGDQNRYEGMFHLISGKSLNIQHQTRDVELSVKCQNASDIQEDVTGTDGCVSFNEALLGNHSYKKQFNMACNTTTQSTIVKEAAEVITEVISAVEATVA